MKCSTCKGSGTVVLLSGPGRGKPRPLQGLPPMRCPTCDGTGQAPK